MECRKKIAVAILALALAGCSSLGGKVLGSLMGSSGGGIQADTELTVGKKEETLDVETQLGDRNQQQANTIINESGLTLWQLGLLCLLAGWAIPTPYQTATGMRKVWKALTVG